MIDALVLALEIDVARICAKYERYTPPSANAEIVDCDLEQFCSVTLATKYANGDGVARDYEAAEYFLCEAAQEVAVAEHESMLEHLQKMRSGEEAGELDYCDHVTSGYGSTYCASVHYDEVMPQLEARLAKIATNAKLAPLRRRADAFLAAESESANYESRGGTAHSAIVLYFDIEWKEHFVETLERLSTSRAPAVTADEAKSADAALNAAYRTKMREMEDVYDHDDVDPKTLLRDAQRAWITYRDAFADYYVARWRGAAPADALRREIVTQLTIDRTKALAPQ